MKLIKRLLYTFLTFSLLLPAAVYAEDNQQGIIEITDISVSDISLFDARETPAYSDITDEEVEFMEYLMTEFQKRSTSFSVIDKFKITVDRFMQLRDNYLWAIMQFDHPEIFYVQGIGGTRNGAYMNEIIVQYTPEEELAPVLKAINSETDKIKSLLTDDMTDLEKILAVHDYIISNYEYDTDLQSRNLDTMVMQKKGVCQGYAYLFKYMLDQLNIECVTVPSNACAHMWNKVKLDGEWYNVDLTYDDPLPDMSTNITHKYFLMNDDEIRVSDYMSPSSVKAHTSWNEFKWDGKTPVEVSSDTAYSDSKLREICGTTVYKNGSFYGIDAANNICEIIFGENVLRPVYTKSASFIWRPYGEDNAQYAAYFSALAMYNGEIYFNSPNKIFRFNPSDGSEEEIYEYTQSQDISDTYLYGLFSDDNGLFAEYTTDLGIGTEQIISIPVPAAPAPAPAMPCKSEIVPVGGGNVEISIDVPSEEYIPDEDDVVYVAEYRNGVLVNIVQKPLSQMQEENKINYSAEGEDSTEVKVFVWDGSCTPLAALSSFNL